MKGWILSFLIDNLDYMGYPKEILNRKNYNHLSWSQYDRINIKETDNFKEFCDSSAIINAPSELKWIGTERCLHLLPDEVIFGENFEWKAYETQKDEIMIKCSASSENNFGFYTVITFRYSCDILKYKNDNSFKFLSEDIRRDIYKHIKRFVSDKNFDMCFYPFQSLEAEDLVFIFLSDDLSQVSDCIEFLKGLTYINNSKECQNVFDSLSVFSGINIINFSQNPKMDAMVKISFKNKPDINDKIGELLNYLEDQGLISKNEIVLRDTCVYVHIKCSEKMLSLFNEDGYLNGSSPFYEGYIKNSRTFWIKRLSANKVESQRLDNIKWDNYELVENKETNELSNSSVSNHVAQFIINEYDRLIKTPRCAMWKPVLVSQREVVVKLVNEYERLKDNETLCSLLNHVQTSLTYINQACSPIYEIPNHNYYYQGSYNDVLKMYYGIIYAILQIGYYLPHSNSTTQIPICFAVNFEATAKVHSIMYTEANDELRFVVFHLPYENFSNYSEIIPALIHEVFHYITPFDREYRVYKLIDIIAKRILTDFMTNIFTEYEIFDETAKQKIQEYFLGLIEQIVNSTIDYFKNVFSGLYSLSFSHLHSMVFESYKSAKPIYKYILTKYIKIFNEDIRDVIHRDLKNVPEAQIDLYKSLSKYHNVFTDKIEFNKYDRVIINNELSDFVDYIFNSAKEIFCDMFMIKILNLNFNEYIRIVYRILKDSCDESQLKYYFLEDTSVSSNLIMESFTLRFFSICSYFYNQYSDNIKKNDNKTKLKEGLWLQDELKNVLGFFVDQNDIEIFNLFEDYIVKNYDFYKRTYSVYNDLILEMSCNKEHIEFDFCSDSIMIDLVESLKEIYKDKPGESINIELIQKFIYFYGADSKNTNISEKKQYHSKKFMLSFYEPITSLEEYVFLVRDIVSKINTNHKVWFRGVCNDQYHLSPGLYRSLNYDLSLYTNQANILKFAYEKTLSYKDLWNCSIVQQMCMLQHFGISTNLLDFSLDMLVALHFALNPDIEDDSKRIDSGEFTPAVYIFDPIVYSKAIDELRRGQVLDKKYDAHISPIIYDIEKNNKDHLFLEKMDYDFLYNHTIKHNQPYKSSNRTDLFPVPIIVRQDNIRIRAQNGVFLAYSLDIMPDCDAGEKQFKYDYLSLDIIQKRYRDFLSSNGKPEEKFLYRILIDSSSVDSLRKDLKLLNVTEGKMYPDVTSVLRQTMKEYKSGLSI